MTIKQGLQGEYGVAHGTLIYYSETEERCRGTSVSPHLSGQRSCHLTSKNSGGGHTHTVRRTGRLSFETSFQSNWHHPVPLNLNISGQRHSGTSALLSYFNKCKSILLLFFETNLKIRRGDGGTLAWKRNWWTKQARTSQDAWTRRDLLQVFFQSLQQFYIWIALFLCFSLTLKALHQETIIHENIDP